VEGDVRDGVGLDNLRFAPDAGAEISGHRTVGPVAAGGEPAGRPAVAALGRACPPSRIASSSAPAATQMPTDSMSCWNVV
jgi:hypothetical protein